MHPRHYAISLIEQLKIDSLPIDPFSIAESLNISVVETNAKGYEGLLIKVSENTQIIISNKITNYGRKKFTLAHELGHYSIPSHTKDSFECTADFFSPFKINPLIEDEANQFASELLLPEKFLKPILHTCKPDFESMNELAEDCEASLTATSIKFVDLTEDCCALIATSNNKIRWFRKSTSFPYYIEQGSQITAGTLTASYSLNGVLKEPCKEKIHASYWFNGKGIDSSTTLMESCLPMPYYDVVLTIIWFPDPSFDSSGYGDIEKERRYEESPWRWADPDE